MTQTTNSPRPTLDREAVGIHFHTALRYRTPAAVWTAIADVPVLLAELDRLVSLLTRARIESANLLAAARATLAAEYDGEPDPLAYLRDELATYQPLATIVDESEHASGR